MNFAEKQGVGEHSQDATGLSGRSGGLLANGGAPITRSPMALLQPEAAATPWERDALCCVFR